MSNFYWISPTGSVFDSTSNWSLSSGGSPGTAIPGSSDTVYFDASGLGDSTFNIPVTLESFQIMAGYTGTILIDTTSIVRNDITLSGGILTRGSDGTISVLGDVYCNRGFGELSNSHNAVIRMNSEGDQNIFTEGGILPCLMIDKTTANVVGIYGQNPLQTNSDFIIENGTINTRGIDVHIGIISI